MKLATRTAAVRGLASLVSPPAGTRQDVGLLLFIAMTRSAAHTNWTRASLLRD